MSNVSQEGFSSIFVAGDGPEAPEHCVINTYLMFCRRERGEIVLESFTLSIHNWFKRENFLQEQQGEFSWGDNLRNLPLFESWRL